MSDFDGLKHCLADWPRLAPPGESLVDHSCERLRRVLSKIWEDRLYPGIGDLAGLIQHVLRRQATLFPGASAWKVPCGQNWPDAELWRQSRLNVAAEGSHSLTIAADKSWSADWLVGSDRLSPLAAVLREDVRRKRGVLFLPLDPAVQIDCGLKYDSYSCSGQQQGIHAALLMRPGATMTVNLPTGSGKSLVAWAASILADPTQLTVIVMPTVALALDQEQQMLSQFRESPRGSSLPAQLAWHGELDGELKREIRQRLRDGTQRVLFASPEAIVGSLCRELYQTAREGRLKYLVIDEAHLVAQWGTEFRPEFQSMAGLRRELIKVCPSSEHRLRTLLLSATLTEECIDVLRLLFADDVFDVISAVHLRPEPEYWISQAPDEPEKQARVLELVRVVPRPFLLYVTEREDAVRWSGRLQATGLRRLGCVHGGTSGDERRRVVDDWREGRLDCVVATSAFGLGMDKDDVRAVIHACVPETVDRLYQEVGRGGRDGKACVSFLVYTDRDLEVAQGLSTDCFISIDRGFERWSDMMNVAMPINGFYRLDLSTLPADKSKDSAANRAWNLRTILMLNRAGLIRIENSSPPDIEREEDEDDDCLNQRRQAARDEYAKSCFVSLLDNGHRHMATWQRLVEPMRLQSLQRDQQGFAELRALLNGRREMMDVLAKTYEVPTFGVHPVKVCGGCSCCRFDDDAPRQCLPPTAVSGTNPLVIVKEPLRELMSLSQNNLLLVACPPDLKEIDRQLQRLVLPRLVTLGISEIALPAHWQQQRAIRDLYLKSPQRFVIHCPMTDCTPAGQQLWVPRVTVFLPDDGRPFDLGLLHIARPLHIIFASATVKDPRRREGPNKPLDNYFERASHISYESLLGRLQL